MSSMRFPFSVENRDARSDQPSPFNTVISPPTPGTPGTLAEPSAEEPPYPLPSRDTFFPLSLYSSPEWRIDLSEPDEDSLVPNAEREQVVVTMSNVNPTTPEPPSEYDNAVARVRGLDAFLTPSMKSTLTSMLSVIQMHLSSPTLNGGTAITNPLFTTVASPDEMSDQGVKDLVDTIEKGLLVFSALGGGSTGTVTGPISPAADDTGTGSRKRQKIDGEVVVAKSTRRSERVRRDCKARDPACQICNSIGGGDVAHIIPYSAKGQKGIDFWRFVELFRGVEATAALRAVALAPNPESVDTMKNVWFLCKACHDAFGRAQLAVIPDLAGITYPYDPDLTRSYPANIEFPQGHQAISIACWKQGPRGRRIIDKELDEGHMITLSTDNALTLPLPHPLLFQIHAIISRVIAMKAAAGFPLFPVLEGEDDDDDDDDHAVPAFTDNTFLNWLDRHAQPAHPEVLPDQHAAAGTPEPRILRWCEQTPTFAVERAFPAPPASGASRAAAMRHLKRTHVDDSVTDGGDERPRKYTVVLSEACQRMDEKRQLADRRLNEPEYMYWCG